MNKAALLDCEPTKIVVFSNITVPHGCSTRVGGVSLGHLSSLNTGFTVGDDAANVWENRRRFSQALEQENLPWLLSMTHGNEVVLVSEKVELPSDLSKRPSTHFSADGCVTNRKGVPLSLTVADCVPVFFHDPVKKAVGVSHAGWRGTVSGIVAKTVESFQKQFASDPGDIQIAIGPSIGPTAFEVGPEVVREFETAFPDVPGVITFHPQTAKRSKGKALVNLWLANEIMAMRAGVPKANIEISGWCTASNPDLFFSHRRDEGKSGRLLAGIVLT